jgi:hypothetical protein
MLFDEIIIMMLVKCDAVNLAVGNSVREIAICAPFDSHDSKGQLLDLFSSLCKIKF